MTMMTALKMVAIYILFVATLVFPPMILLSLPLAVMMIHTSIQAHKRDAALRAHLRQEIELARSVKPYRQW